MRVCRTIGVLVGTSSSRASFSQSLCELLRDKLPLKAASLVEPNTPTCSKSSTPFSILDKDKLETAVLLLNGQAVGELEARPDLLEELLATIGWALQRVTKPGPTPARCGQCALAHAGRALICTDLKGFITVFSPAAEKLYGVQAGEAVGLHVSHYCPTELRRAQQDRLDQLLQDGKPVQVETFRLTHDGMKVPVELYLSLQRDQLDRPIGFLGVVKDISDRKSQEKILEEVQKGTESATGVEFFQELVSRLAVLLEVPFVLVSAFGSGDQASTLAAWVHGELQDAFHYSLSGSPCENVRDFAETCFYPSGAQELFPRDKDLVEFSVESYLGVPLLGPDNQVLGVLIAMDQKPMADIPIRRHALEVFATRAAAELVRLNSETALKQSENRFRALMEQSPAAIAIFAPDGERTNANSAWRDLLGDHQLSELGLQDDFEQALAGESAQTPERQATVHGLEAWLKASFYPLLDSEGRTLNVVTVIEDFTSYQEGLERIRRLSERLELALKAGSFGVWDFDLPHGRILWDERMYEIYGLAVQEPEKLFKAWRNTIHPEDLTLVREVWDLSLQEGTPMDTTFRIKRVDGEVRYIRTNAVVLRNDRDEPYRIIGINIDITEGKLAQRDRDLLQDQLSQAQRMESLGRLAGGVAHDFNNMLSVIIGNAELALSCMHPDEEFREELLEIKEAARRSAALTQQLLFFARKQEIDPVTLKLNPLVENILKMLERVVGEQVTILWEPGSELWHVKADSNQLDQVLMNLCINAKDAMSSSGQVTISTRNVTVGLRESVFKPGLKAGEYVELKVSDTGEGMDEETQKRVFEPFFTTKGINKGTGLGMSTVYGIIQSHGGFIDVESQLGEGTSIRALFPRCVEVVVTEAKDIQPANGGKETILLVEDQQHVLRIAKRMLQNLGYQVLAATNPQQAIDLIQNGEPEIHLLLTDVVMPDMNGAELAESLRRDFPNLRCLFMSGYTADVMAEQGVRDEGFHFLCKPFTQSELATKVRKLLDEEQLQTPA